MSEAADQPAAETAPAPQPGVEAEAPATTTPETDDIDTEAFDRSDTDPNDPDAAPEGQADGAEGEVKPDAGEPAASGETIEIEVAGKKVSVPKELEPLLMFQADYTKKTQAVADERKQVEAQASELAAREAQQAESLKAFRAEHMAIGQYERGISDIDAKLAEYAKVSPDDWAALRVQNPEDYEAHRANRQLLRDSRADYAEALGRAQEDLKGKEAKFVEQQTSARNEKLTKAWEATNQTLSKTINGWSPAKGQELADKVLAPLGVTSEELREATDSRVWILADEVARLRAENASLKTGAKQAAATDAALKSQTVTPAVKPAGGSAPPRGVNDQISTEEWMKRRNAQEARKRAKG